MDIFEWLMNEGTVLDGTVIVRLLIVGFAIELISLGSYWLRRF